MVTLEDYNLENGGFLGDMQQGQDELVKAMQAGQITGRDTADQLLTMEPLKVESLDTVLKLMEFRAKDIKLWNAISKKSEYNTVSEFLQLRSYGEQRGGFYNEGELSDVEDSQYMRKAEHVKYMQVTGEVTLQAQMTKSYVDAMKQETENKMQWILRLVNKSLLRADSEIIPQQFNGIYKQHASVGSGEGFLYSTYEDYYKSGTVIDLRGKALTQENLEDAAVNIDINYGDVEMIVGPTTVISGFAKDYYETQRILLGNNGFNGQINSVPKSVTTTLGDIALMSDKMTARAPFRTMANGASSQKSPAAPATVAVTLTSDSLVKYAGTDLGNCFYAVASVNRYGESALTVLSTPVTLASGQRPDIQVTPGTGGILPSGYVVYRTRVTTATTPAGLEFYPIFEVSAAQLSSGFNGAAAGKIGDRGYYLPGCEDALVGTFSDEVMSFKQLAPISKLDLAVISMSRRFITFLFGTPVLYTPKKVVKIINVGRSK